MDNLSLHQLLTIFSWFGLSVVLFLLALIARFYEELSSQRTYYQFFAIPVLAFAGATVRFSQLDQVTRDVWGDLCLLVGGVSLAALCLHVYRLMTSGR
jgi:phosphoglycerol transferase MdoB-like AlkP superfamily enzyme